MNQNYLTVNNVAANIINSKKQIAPIIMKEQKPNLNLMNNNNNMPDGRYKRKYGVPYPGQQSASVVRRNARERNRVKQVNNGFAKLRQHIPMKVISALSNTNGRGASKKLSKVDTLKLAVEYIKSLQSVLEGKNNKLIMPDHLNYSSGHSSEVSVSPTPSYASSDTSLIGGNNNSYQIKEHFKTEPYDSYVEQSDTPSPTIHQTYPNNAHYIHAGHHYKKSLNDSYIQHSQVSPDDEELLDTIAWWQEQQ